MIIERKDEDHWTDLYIYAEGERHPLSVYRVVCMDVDTSFGQHKPPTARISPLSTTSATPDDLTRLAHEYLFVAGAAAALQAEKRAKYAERFGEVGK